MSGRALFALRAWSGDHPLYCTVSAFKCKASKDFFKDNFGTYLLLSFPGALREEIYSSDEDRISCQTGSIWDPINFFWNFLKANGKVSQGYAYISESDPYSFWWQFYSFYSIGFHTLRGLGITIWYMINTFHVWTTAFHSDDHHCSCMNSYDQWSLRSMFIAFTYDQWS